MADNRNRRPRIAGQRRPKQADPREGNVAEGDLKTTESSTETTVEDVTPATSELPEPSKPKPKRPVVTQRERRQSDVLLAALGLVVVVTLVVAAVLGVKAWHGKQAEDARDQAAAAGRKAAETALSYDYRDLDKSFAAARATMTPDFAAKFDATAKVAGELATKTKATVKADVREVGVRDGDADRVTLIIFVNQTTTSTITKGSPRVDLNRTRFTMVRNGDRWLVQEIAGL
jgi:Mce-associated membrane protein